MPNKSFSIYDPKAGNATELNESLILEVGERHIACISKNKNKLTTAFELFDYTENEAADFSGLFEIIAADSTVINQSYKTAEVFINNELSVLTPILNFNPEIAADYLTVMFGEDAGSKIQFEQLPAEPGIINIFRIKQHVSNVLQNYFANVTYRHTWSNIVKTVISDISAYPSECMYIQFYNTFIIAVVLTNRQVQIIQSFIKESPEDVLYILLNITENFALDKDNMVLQISGMIDLHFTLYRHLITYFRHVKVQNIDTSELPPQIKEYPLHYFTPFFNLAL
jgi:hypothetical protein